MEEEMVLKMKGSWHVSLLRTDNWVCVAEPQPLKKARAGEYWLGSDAVQA